MILVVAIILVVLDVVHGNAALVLVAAACTIEISQTGFWLWYSQRRRAMVGAETMVGQIAEVAEDCSPFGHVRVRGELWRARCDATAARGEQVRIVGRDGLTLEVERAAG